MALTNLQYSVITLIIDLGGSVFGGAVRDLIALETPNDIDCFLSRDNHFLLLGRLSQLGELTSCGELTLGYSTNGHGSRWHLKTPESVCFIDVVNVESKHLPDCDVNRLLLNNAGISVMPGYCNHRTPFVELLEIVTHIHQRVFIPEPEMSDNRYDKMLEKGYHDLTAM